MRFKTNHIYEGFIKALGIDPLSQKAIRSSIDLAERFAEELADLDGIDDVADIAYVMGRDMVEATVCDYFGIESISPAAYEALMDCQFIGDGDCPECGGELELYDTSRDYDEETGEKVIYDIWRCPECGYTEEVPC